MASKTRFTLSAGCNCPDKYSLADLVTGNARTEFMDRTDGFVSYRKARLDGTFASNDMDVGAANRRQAYFDDCFTRAGFRNRLFFQAKLTRRMKHEGFHRRTRQTAHLVFF